MLRNLEDLESYKISGIDGAIGEVHDFYFDDESWAIRYLTVATGGTWQIGREVLISPIAFRDVDFASKQFHLALTREKIRNSPSVDLHKPVSRQYEQEYFQYYNWPYYWGYGGIWGTGELPVVLAAQTWQPPQHRESGSDPHLRSAREVRGYHIKATDDEIGHVSDFVVDDRTWSIRYLVVSTGNWWIGKKVLLAPGWIDTISWPESLVRVKLPREVIRTSPPWDPRVPVDREYETLLYSHYGWPSYWLGRGDPPPAS